MIATGGFGGARAQSPRPTSSLAGVVIDERKAPLSGVEIRGGDRSVLSGVDGRFILDPLQPGRRQFTARRVGYAPESLSVNFDPARFDTLEFLLHSATATLDRL